jgi:hypothetical protein
MPRQMFDAITPSRIPTTTPEMVAGYLPGGSWPSYAEMVTRFPGAVHVSIAVAADVDAQVLDVENLDATPAESVGWTVRQRARGQVPTVYCNVSTWPAVLAAHAAASVSPPLWWAARYDDTAEMWPGAIAKQHTTTDGYDLSIVADHWPGVDPEPTTSTTPPEDDTMLNTYRNTETGETVTAGIGHWRTVENPAYLILDNARGLVKMPPVDVNAAEFGYFRGLYLAEPVDAAILADLDKLVTAQAGK